MRISTEFPAWCDNNIEKLKDKQVLMYCTGGIRCERATALFKRLGHEQVYHLKGGECVVDYVEVGTAWMLPHYYINIHRHS